MEVGDALFADSTSAVLTVKRTAVPLIHAKLAGERRFGTNSAVIDVAILVE